MMKTICNVLLLAIVISASLMSCDKEDPINTDVPYVDESTYTPSNNSDNNKDNVDIQKIIEENTSVNIKYEFYGFKMELYTYLTDSGKYFANRSDIKYGVEWYYTDGQGCDGYYYLDPQNKFMDVTKHSSNHYSVIIPTLVTEDENECALLQFYFKAYYEIKSKESKGETLRSDDKEMINLIENRLKPYASMPSQYRGKVFVDINGKKYYIKSFQK